jgi:hypothetical protein
MKAKYNASAKTKWTTSHRKEGKCFFEELSIVTFDPAEANPRHRLNKPVELRLYGTGNQNFACLWVRVPGLDFNKEVYTQGSGRAGGYGYHRPSAATAEAISNAGFALDADIGGVGESAMEEALCAIADALGIKGYAVVRSHP